MEDRIRDWLKSQGYPLEMRVARSFRAAGFQVIQSEFYEDVETGAQRETDVTARIDCHFPGVLARIEFVIECKSTPNKPWILFTAERLLADPARVVQRAGSKLGAKVLMRLCQRKDVQNLDLFQFHGRSAYGLTQAFTTGSDVTYAAATSVSNATAAEIKRANWYTSAGHPICYIVFPLIVVDAQLMEAYLKDDGEIAVNKVNSGTLVWRHRLVGEVHTIIGLIRSNQVETFATKMVDCCRRFFELSNEAITGVATEGEDVK